MKYSLVTQKTSGPKQLLSLPHLFLIPNSQGKNLVGTVAVPMNWLHLNQVATEADTMAR